MRFIPSKPLIGAQKCAITKRQKDSRGFIHTGVILTDLDPEVFISAAAAEEMGKLIGMVPEKEVDALRERVKAMEEESAQLHAKFDALANAERVIRELETDHAPA